MTIELRSGYDFVQLDAQDLIKLMKFVSWALRCEFSQLVVETDDNKISSITFNRPIEGEHNVD